MFRGLFFFKWDGRRECQERAGQLGWAAPAGHGEQSAPGARGWRPDQLPEVCERGAMHPKELKTGKLRGGFKAVCCRWVCGLGRSCTLAGPPQHKRGWVLRRGDG